ncbi:MAG: TSUP family transporter [Gammaproteobacteria bacterium]
MLNFHLHHWLMPILALTGLTAGTVDAIAGGGGMISLPMLLAVGMPPHLALGTNKLQGSIGTFVAAMNYYRRGMWSLKTVYKGLIFGFLGAVSGAYLSQHISSALLAYIIPALLIAVLIYSIFMPSLGLIDRHPRMSEQLFFPLAGMILGFYDGFFGPATGSFWVFALVFFLGYNLAKATAYTKVFNLKSNIFATICFALGHNIDYRAGLMMAVGQLLGGQLGSHLVIKNGAKFVRPVFLSVVLLTTVFLLFKQFYI